MEIGVAFKLNKTLKLYQKAKYNVFQSGPTILNREL